MKQKVKQKLTDMNDNGDSFKKIAKVIESNPEGLFDAEVLSILNTSAGFGKSLGRNSTGLDIGFREVIQLKLLDNGRRKNEVFS